MGVNRPYGYSSSSWNPPPKLPNPDPGNYEWLDEAVFTGPGGNFVVVKLHYPDCTNYEGDKILVYKGFANFRYIEKYNKKRIDPHFADRTDYASPIARFEPTDAGWIQAGAFAQMMSQLKE